MTKKRQSLIVVLLIVAVLFLGGCDTVSIDPAKTTYKQGETVTFKWTDGSGDGKLTPKMSIIENIEHNKQNCEDYAAACFVGALGGIFTGSATCNKDLYVEVADSDGNIKAKDQRTGMTQLSLTEFKWIDETNKPLGCKLSFEVPAGKETIASGVVLPSSNGPWTGTLNLNTYIKFSTGDKFYLREDNIIWDGDGDGYGNGPKPYYDCNDTDPAIHPGIAEGTPGSAECGDAKDNDCDGDSKIDLQDPDCIGCTASTDKQECPLQQGVCKGSTQTCGANAAWPGCTATTYGSNYDKTEIKCDGLDNDCDGSIDEDGVCNRDYYCDFDHDGLISSTVSVVCTDYACWSSYIGCATSAGTDCNDNNRNIYPGAIEVCSNGINDDCDADTDEPGCVVPIGHVIKKTNVTGYNATGPLSPLAYSDLAATPVLNITFGSFFGYDGTKYISGINGYHLVMAIGTANILNSSITHPETGITKGKYEYQFVSHRLCFGYACIPLKKYPKYDWDNEVLGACAKESMCFVSASSDLSFFNSMESDGKYKLEGTNKVPFCVEDGWSYEDNYCEKGNWTTRTRMLALALLDYLPDTTTQYSLMCDGFAYNDNALTTPLSLNYIDYSPLTSGEGDVPRSFILGEKSTDNIGSAYECGEGSTIYTQLPCTNNFCVLRYKDPGDNKINVLAGTSLNMPLDVKGKNHQRSMLQFFKYDLNIANINPSSQDESAAYWDYCKKAIDDQTGADKDKFYGCINRDTKGNSRIFVNNKTQMIIFKQESFNFNPTVFDSAIKALSHPFITLKNLFTGLTAPGRLPNQLNESIAEIGAAKDAHVIYIASNGTKTIRAFSTAHDSSTSLSTEPFYMIADFINFTGSVCAKINSTLAPENSDLYYDYRANEAACTDLLNAASQKYGERFRCNSSNVYNPEFDDQGCDAYGQIRDVWWDLTSRIKP